MATVRRPSSVAARMTRMAISERFATRSFRGFLEGPDGVGRAAPFLREAEARADRESVGIREERFYSNARARRQCGDGGKGSAAQGLLILILVPPSSSNPIHETAFTKIASCAFVPG